MANSCEQLEQKLKKMLETKITRDRSDDMKSYLSDVYKIHFGKDDRIWQRLKDSDCISPTKGYAILTEILEHFDEILLKAEAEKIIRDIQVTHQKLCSEEHPRKRSLKSQSSVDQDDPHKQLLKKIARGLDANEKCVKELKVYLNFYYPEQFTSKDEETNMDGLSLLTRMEKRGLLSRDNYKQLFDALDHIQLKKFHPSIEEVFANFLRSDSCNENLLDYAKGVPAKGYVFDNGFKTRSVVEDFLKCGYTLQQKIDGRLKMPFDADIAVTMSELGIDESLKIIRAPEVERIGKKTVPVVHLVNVRCSGLPEETKPAICSTCTHSYWIFLFTCDVTIAEKIWTIFSYFLESEDSIEQMVKYWIRDVEEEVECESYRLLFSSTLCKNLNLSLKPPLQRMTQPR